MTNPELETTQALVARLADLQARMQAARLVGADVTTFRKVAAMIDDGRGDELIAASFLVGNTVK
ncbi:hypothetical protein NLY43_14055 [Mesorhizobium sp. C416B]|uniref:hypothetical protein n=1 Tax=unclassified Mesorhizobium TaxID=325217 RepID=UPI0003CE6951|nr:MULTISPECIES: hypothetical protein [unclassified Mesorhizobium]ESX09963.1 hypothetical protein X768_17000 [Mesorhizobium sp. LSJC265A00]ESX41112.1 hypothetical protein X762_30235 [Mesorhizobium sp. LSHC426A00]ESX50754.1 hypothetical protein X761_25870 [Mesorhizobium sp. LSHC424B00]ESX60206.1 hypothetical protein X758_33520 [Mesorhizobium sp. LSHC416B00]ESY03364.1 hypothetical protein X753_19760 [Mesorhizobium sp. LNJC399B00]